MIFNTLRRPNTTPNPGGTLMSRAKAKAQAQALAPGAIGDARRPSPTATRVGEATPRADANATPAPPNAVNNASDAASLAREAGRRARRKGAGSSVLTGLPVTGGGAARIRTRTLLGS